MYNNIVICFPTARVHNIVLYTTKVLSLEVGSIICHIIVLVQLKGDLFNIMTEKETGYALSFDLA